MNKIMTIVMTPHKQFNNTLITNKPAGHSQIIKHQSIINTTQIPELDSKKKKGRYHS